MDKRILIFACAVRIVQCFPSGKVTDSCTRMIPQHGPSNGQTSTAPYTVTTDRMIYREGDQITVTLQSTSTAFEGFLLQAWEVGAGRALGSFVVANSAAQLLTCSGLSNSAVSHTSNSKKTSVQATWTAPTTNTLQNIEFRATFVQSYAVFWVAVKSLPLTYSGANPLVNSTNTPSTATPNPAVSPISYAGCGSRKFCFTSPLNCDPSLSANCYFVSSKMASNSSEMQFEISGRSDGYVAIGFSDDKKMGNDGVYICGLDSNGLLQVQRAYSTGRWTPEIQPLGNVSHIRTTMRDGVISCSFSSWNPISTQRSLGVGPSYYLMMANGATREGVIQFHISKPLISENKVDISNPQVATDGQVLPSLVKAHGALMLIAWMTTSSLGMLIARYLKGVARGRGCSGKDVWFLAHVSLMSVSVTSTGIAFILVFSEAQGWSGGAHSVLGCIVTILAFIQPIAAIFRGAPQDKKRFIFNWAHSLNALVIKCLAVAAIFTALAFVDLSSSQWMQKVMGGFIGWEVLAFILLEVHRRCCHKHDEEKTSKSAKVEVLLLLIFFLGNVAFLVSLLVGIGMA